MVTAVLKRTRDCCPLTVHKSFPSLTKTFLQRHPCRMLSVRYGRNCRCDGRGREFESRRPRHSSSHFHIAIGHTCDVRSIHFVRAVQAGCGNVVQLFRSPTVKASCSKRCVKTVSKPLRFGALEFCLSEKQTPQVIVFTGSRQNEESV